MFNYDSLATVDDGSCFPIRLGCMSDWADNYNDYDGDGILNVLTGDPQIDINTDDGSCYRYGCMDELADNYDVLATIDDGSCYREGCMSDWADNYDALATQNTLEENECYRVGCMSDWADNYDTLVTIDDESCYRYGCTSNLAVNYDEYATIDNDNCDFDIITHLNMSFDAWNISFDLNAGWNMFGYGCPNPIDVVEGLSNHTESIAIVKDNNGEVYLPEWDYNGIGDFTPGFGYQIKVTETIEGFSLCDWYVNDIPEDNIVSLQDSLQLINSQIGCTDSLACNYDVNKLYDDGSCEYPEPGYNCEGNINIQLGDEAFGGIVFYLDETGEFGLVASGQDLHEVGGTELEEGSFGYEWGCSNINKSWSNGYSIGTGYQNTINIVNEGCVSSNGGITAAQAATNFVYEGFNDWYLPSIDELSMMMNFLGIAEDMGLFYVPPYGSFANEWYQSSTYKEGSDDIWQYQEYMNTGSCDGPTRVRAIRSFGNWTIGCMDETACNYNSDANMVDDSCEYPELGYDCDGNINVQIGDEAFGGIIFYVDETGEHGLVAALEDIGEFDGYDASEAAYNFIFEIYNDWYLPDMTTLQLLYNEDVGNYYGFYWSSISGCGNYGNHYGQVLNFNDGEIDCVYKSYNPRKVLPIRSF